MWAWSKLCDILNFLQISVNILKTVQDTYFQWKTNRQSYMTYRMAPMLVTTNDLEGHSQVAVLFECIPSNTYVVFYKISTDSLLARYLGYSWASCFWYSSISNSNNSSDTNTKEHSFKQLFPEQPGFASTRRVSHSWCYWSKRWCGDNGILCTLLQTDNCAGMSSLSFSAGRLLFCSPTNSVKALKAFGDHASK